MQKAREARLAQQAYAAKACQAAKQEFASRQRQAMRNKAAAEGQLGIGPAYRSPSPSPQSPALEAELACRRAYAGDYGAAIYEPRRRDGDELGYGVSLTPTKYVVAGPNKK